METTEQMVQQAKKVVEIVGQETEQSAQQVAEQAKAVLPLVERVITQTRKRVLEGKKVPASEKVLNLFEPQTRAIPRHKGGALVEFGRQVRLDEVDGGIVTRYQILEHPEEHGQAVDAAAHHQMVFAHPPHLVAADRRVHSAETEEKLKAAGVKQVAIPMLGKAPEERRARERTPFDGAIGGEQGSKEGLRVCGGTTSGARAAIMAAMGWNGDWAWEFWRATCAASLASQEHSSSENKCPRYEIKTSSMQPKKHHSIGL